MKKEVIYKEIYFFEIAGKKIPMQAITTSAIWFFFLGTIILAYNIGVASAIEIQKSTPIYSDALPNGDMVICGMLADGLQLRWDCFIKSAKQTNQEIPDWYKNLSGGYGE